MGNLTRLKRVSGHVALFSQVELETRLKAEGHSVRPDGEDHSLTSATPYQVREIGRKLQEEKGGRWDNFL